MCLYLISVALTTYPHILVWRSSLQRPHTSQAWLILEMLVNVTRKVKSNKTLNKTTCCHIMWYIWRQLLTVALVIYPIHCSVKTCIKVDILAKQSGFWTLLGNVTSTSSKTLQTKIGPCFVIKCDCYMVLTVLFSSYDLCYTS